MKIDGLKQFYGITAPEALSFFTVHEEADVYHSRGERDILYRYIISGENREACLAAAEKSACAMLRLLGGVHRAYVRSGLN